MWNSLIVFSGGLDSTTILLDCLHRKETPLCILFDYGQEHKIELSYAKNICNELLVDYEIIDLPCLNRDNKDMIVGHRNIVFLSFAHYFAKLNNINKLYCGFCEGDNSGFPDCKKEFIDSAQKTLDIGYGEGTKIITPLLNYSKGEIFFLNFRRRVLDFVIKNTLTCYHGVETLNCWGRGCEECLSCLSRKNGYKEFKEYYFEN